MVQAELPLVYKGVHAVSKSPRYELPLRWKAVFVLLIIYSIALSSFVFVKADQTRAESSQGLGVSAEQTPASSANGHAESAQVKMAATVAGWYNVEKIDNTNIHVMTNMKVWVNGREFIRCDECEQKKLDPSLLEY